MGSCVVWSSSTEEMLNLVGLCLAKVNEKLVIATRKARVAMDKVHQAVTCFHLSEIASCLGPEESLDVYYNPEETR